MLPLFNVLDQKMEDEEPVDSFLSSTTDNLNIYLYTIFMNGNFTFPDNFKTCYYNSSVDKISC